MPAPPNASADTPLLFDALAEAIADGALDSTEAAGQLYEALSDSERLGLLDGDQHIAPGLLRIAVRGYNTQPFVAGAVPRLGIPGIRFTDGPRGIAMGHSTAFPVAIARGATWDVDLEQRVGAAIAREGRALGANLFAGVCVNALRHPAWGRAQETYGEDPVHLGEMGAAITRAVRSQLMVCVKHFALNSMENARFTVDVQVSQADLHERFLPHFRDVIEAGAESVMSAYNSVNGTWCGDNSVLLQDILRDEWGFDGFVMTDFIWGLRDPVGSVAAGQDLEMPFRQQRARTLPRAARQGALDPADVRRAGIRLLAAQLVHYSSLRRTRPTAAAPMLHAPLAREVAAAGMVLLRNEPDAITGTPALPLGSDVGNVAVLGAIAQFANQGDSGSSQVRAPSASTVLDALREKLGTDAVRFDAGRNIAQAAEHASQADAAVVVVGFTNADEGESMIGIDGAAAALMGWPLRNRLVRALTPKVARIAGKLAGFPGGDRTRLRLHDADRQLIEAVAAANPRTVVVLVAGGPLLISEWDERVPAVLMAWYPGMEGGRAITDVLFGHAEPGGRLPAAIPMREDHLPEWNASARRITYGRWWGQSWLDQQGHRAAYPLGFGLGYATFALHNIEVGPVQQTQPHPWMTVTATATNTGTRSASTVVQIHALPLDGHQPRQLLGFAKVTLTPGAQNDVTIHATLRPLSRRDPAQKVWRLQPGEYRIEAAQFSGDPKAATTTLVWGEPLT